MRISSSMSDSGGQQGSYGAFADDGGGDSSLRVRCPVCGSRIGQPCMTNSGDDTASHGQRLRLARSLGRV